MSTHWGYRCLDCDVESPHWFNHGDEALRDFLALWPHVKAVLDSRLDYFLFKFEPLDAWMGKGAGEDDLFTWVRQHEGHRIVLRNEYGQEQPIEQ